MYQAYCRATQTTSVAEIARPDSRYRPPDRNHWLGTDYLGRDVLVRAVFATRTAFQVGLLAGLISVVAGVTLGALGGYFGGAVDAAVVWLYSTFAAIPSLLFILAFALVMGRGTTPVYLGIGLTSWVGLCRVVRAEFIRLRDVPYVEAARLQGVPAPRLIWRHILPNAFYLVIVFFTLRFGTAIMTEVIVSFLGLGVQLEPSWGVMIAEAKERLWQGVWWELTAATGLMFGLVLAVNLLGDALRDLLDPRLRGAC
jgi:peptide/nickel transport system permease protein